MVFTPKDSVDYWRSVAESNADACAAWFRIAEIRHRTIRKLAWACYGIGAIVLIMLAILIVENY
jgi:uncharacterized integral membrane protein